MSVTADSPGRTRSLSLYSCCPLVRYSGRTRWFGRYPEKAGATSLSSREEAHFGFNIRLAGWSHTSGERLAKTNTFPSGSRIPVSRVPHVWSVGGS